MTDAPQLGRLTVKRKLGPERFRDGAKELGFDLQAFWQWYASDLVSNATRGCLAEYIVAQALDADACGIRDEWAACDLCTPEVIEVEVKSAAFLQTWNQRTLSKISFSTRRTLAWDPVTNLQEKEARRQAHVYVFALLAHTNKASIDPMDLSQWLFYVVATTVLDARTRSQHSITLRSFESLAGPGVVFAGLREAVRAAASTNEKSAAQGTPLTSTQ